MDPLTLFGLFAVTAMLVCYALEDRSHWFILAFAAACLFPNWFSVIAYGLGILCFVAAGSSLAAVSREP